MKSAASSNLQGDDAVVDGDPASPCNLICALDPVTRLCIGCHRSIEEISGWPNYSATQKRAVLEILSTRSSNDQAD